MDIESVFRQVLAGDIEIINKEVKKNNGISGVVYLPKKYIGKKVTIVTEKIEEVI